MKIFSYVLIAMAALAFGLAVFVESRIAPLVGAPILLGTIGYAMWLNKSAADGSFAKAERATRMRRRERARD